MYVPNYSSSAYQLEKYVEQKVDKKAEQEKKKQLKTKIARRKVALGMAIVFLIMFAVLLRYIQIFDLHSEVARQNKKLETIRMENEQTELTIESMTDKAKIQEFAETELGLQKMTDAQIVYLNPVRDNYMVNLSNGRSSGTGGVMGTFAVPLEYSN